MDDRVIYNGLHYTLKGNHCDVNTITIVIITYTISRFYEQGTLVSAITAQVKWDCASDS